jgi:FkbM family methyltransferase
MVLANKLIKAIGCLARPAYRSALLAHHVAAGLEHEPVLRQMDCRMALDVGANRGQFALVARRLFPEARIFSFEPLPGPAARFRAVFAGDAQVTFCEAAIGPERGETTIHISKRDDSSSLLPITAEQDALFPGTAEIGTAMVRVGPLHDFITEDRIEPPALLKLDVQGFELQVLRGCESLLQRFAYVYAECSFVELYGGQALADEVIAWLRERGFRLRGVYNMTYDDAGRAVQADFLFAAGTG